MHLPFFLDIPSPLQNAAVKKLTFFSFVDEIKSSYSASRRQMMFERKPNSENLRVRKLRAPFVINEVTVGSRLGHDGDMNDQNPPTGGLIKW